MGYGDGEEIKKGIEEANRLKNNYRFSFGKYKGKLMRKVIEEKEGVDYCIWLCKTIEQNFNKNPQSKRAMRKNKRYKALKYHLRKIKKYKNYLTINIYGTTKNWGHIMINKYRRNE